MAAEGALVADGALWREQAAPKVATARSANAQIRRFEPGRKFIRIF